MGDGRFGPNDTLDLRRGTGHGSEGRRERHHRPSGPTASGYADYAVERGYLTREEIGDLDAPIRRELIARLAARALKLEPFRKVALRGRG